MQHPAPSLTNPGETYLHDVQRLCKRHGIVFVLDEMITGFRWDLKGAQNYYKVQPDLCTFGKAMANGFAVAAIAGKRDIMELGSIEFPGRERLFLLSTTHGAEMCGLGAFVKNGGIYATASGCGAYVELWQLFNLFNESESSRGRYRRFL